MKLSQPARATTEGAEEVPVLGAQFSKIWTQGVLVMLLILPTVPFAFAAYSRLVRDSVMLLAVQLCIKVVTEEPDSQKGA